MGAPIRLCRHRAERGAVLLDTSRSDDNDFLTPLVREDLPQARNRCAATVFGEGASSMSGVLDIAQGLRMRPPAVTPLLNWGNVALEELPQALGSRPWRLIGAAAAGAAGAGSGT